jgi:hypothetical protein
MSDVCSKCGGDTGMNSIEPEKLLCPYCKLEKENDYIKMCMASCEDSLKKVTKEKDELYDKVKRLREAKGEKVFHNVLEVKALQDKIDSVCESVDKGKYGLSSGDGIILIADLNK